MALSCEELRRLLDEAAPLGTGAAREHLAGCAACRAAVSRSERVATKLAEWADEPAPPFLHERLMAHVRAAGRPRSPQPAWLRRFWWAPTFATALLVAALGVWRTPPAAVRPDPVAPPRTETTGGPAPTLAPPAGAAVAPREPAAPAETTSAAPDTAAPVATGRGPMRGRPSPAAGQEAVACELVGPDGGVRRLRLADAWAPARGSTWGIVVAPSGEVHFAPEPEGSVVASPAPLPTLEALASLDLAPGRYLLRRTEHTRSSPVSSR